MFEEFICIFLFFAIALMCCIAVFGIYNHYPGQYDEVVTLEAIK